MDETQHTLLTQDRLDIQRTTALLRKRRVAPGERPDLHALRQGDTQGDLGEVGPAECATAPACLEASAVFLEAIKFRKILDGFAKKGKAEHNAKEEEEEEEEERIHSSSNDYCRL